MAKCRPVTLDQLVGGQQYLAATLNMRGRLEVEIFTVCGRPVRSSYDEGPLIRIRGTEESAVCEHRHAGGLGLLSLLFENRVFRATARNREILSDLVARQAAAEYLSLIGVGNPEQRLSRNAQHCEEVERRLQALTAQVGP